MGKIKSLNQELGQNTMWAPQCQFKPTAVHYYRCRHRHGPGIGVCTGTVSASDVVPAMVLALALALAPSPAPAPVPVPVSVLVPTPSAPNPIPCPLAHRYVVLLGALIEVVGTVLLYSLSMQGSPNEKGTSKRGA
jgi:hypothetical protein